MERLQPLLNEAEAAAQAEGHGSLSDEEALDILKKIEPMLENLNPDVVDLLDEIRGIRGAEQLVRQIEEFEFKAALQTVEEIKKKIGVK